MNRRPTDHLVRLTVPQRRLIAELCALTGSRSQSDALTNALVLAVRAARDELHTPKEETK